jgi:hypothetical protein
MTNIPALANASMDPARSFRILTAEQQFSIKLSWKGAIFAVKYGCCHD